MNLPDEIGTEPVIRALLGLSGFDETAFVCNDNQRRPVACVELVEETAYIGPYESIVKSGAYVVPGFANDAMPQDIASTLTSQDLADLLAYLMTMH